MTFLEGGGVAEFKLDFICSNLCFAANPISTLSGFFLIFLSKGFICIKLYRFDFFFRTSFKINLPKKSRTKSPRVLTIKGTISLLVWKPLKNALSLLETISKNLSLADRKGSYFPNIESFYFYHRVVDFSSSYKYE